MPTCLEFRPHPRTGERRKVRRSLRLDRLPLALLDRIRAERAAGRTWAEIESDSPHWKEWDQAEPEVLARFPGRRLPHTNLQRGPQQARFWLAGAERWYDLRIEQVRRESEAQSAAAHAAAEHLAARGFTDLTAAVKNALGEAVFSLILNGAGLQAQIDVLSNLSRVLARLDANEISRQRVELQQRKAEMLARKAERSQTAAESLQKGQRSGAPVEPAAPPEPPASRDGIAGIPPYPANRPSAVADGVPGFAPASAVVPEMPAAETGAGAEAASPASPASRPPSPASARQMYSSLAAARQAAEKADSKLGRRRSESSELSQNRESGVDAWTPERITFHLKPFAFSCAA